MTAKGQQRSVEFALDRALASCTRNGVQLTDLRRTVLGLILSADGPLTAYQLLAKLQETRANATPPTVYRALDFLLEQGLIHRVERLNAFIACKDDHPHQHAVQFLICRTCGQVAELEDHGVAAALDHAAGLRGFQPARAVVELDGTCADCVRGA